MRRRSRAGGEPVKTRRRKAMTLKRGNAPKVARRRGSAAAGLNKQGRAAHARTERAVGAADGHRRRAEGHQPLDLRSGESAQHAPRVGGSLMRGR